MARRTRDEGNERRSRQSARRDPAVERERRERERRERERRRHAGRPARPARREQAAGAAVRQRHEGLVGWIARNVARSPRLVVDAPRHVGHWGRSFAHEVAAVVAGIGRGLLRIVPGTGRLSSAGAAAAAARRRIAASGNDAQPAASDRRPRTAGQLRAAAERRARVRTRLRMLGLALLAALAVAAGVFVPASDAFRIRHVEVSGTRAVDDLAVRVRIDSLLAGKTVFTVDEDALERRIEQLPFVRDARVERHLPGGLELHVVEYRPLALAYGDGDFWLVAQDGRVLARTTERAWRGRIPTIELRGREVEPGVHLDDEPALQLLGELGTRSTLEFDVIRTEEFQLEATLVDDVLVRFGRPTQLALKVAAAERTLQLAARNGEELLYVDVSVPGKPARCLVDVAACHQPRGPVDEQRAAELPGAPTTPEESGGDEADVSDVTG